MTTIQDVVHYADGSLANGRLVVFWKPFIVNGVQVGGGELSYQIVDGVVLLTLYSNAAAQPVGSYYNAKYELENGAVYVEQWIVPNFPTVNLGQCKVSFPPSPSVIISPLQLSSLGGQPGMFLMWDGTKWVPGYPSTFNMSPNWIGLVAGTSGTDVNIVGSPAAVGNSMTINIPDASPTARGVVTTGTQSFAGAKTFTGNVSIPGTLTVGTLTVTGPITLPPNSYVPTSRRINTAGGLTGGGPLTADLNLTGVAFNTSTIGMVPAPGVPSGAMRYLREDATWVAPPSSPVVSVFGRTGAVVAQAGDYSSFYVPLTRQINTGAGLAGGGALSADLNLVGAVFTYSAIGMVPAPGGSGSTRYLREDATWVAPSVSVADDTSTQRVEVALAGTLEGTRKQLNFIAGSGQTINVADNSLNNRVDITLAASGTGPASPSIYAVDGTVIGTRPELNLIHGSNVTLSGVDNSGANRVDITVASTGGGVPASPVNSVQFNNAGAFGGSANLTWDNVNSRLGVGTASPRSVLDVQAATDSTLQFGRNGPNTGRLLFTDSSSSPTNAQLAGYSIHCFTGGSVAGLVEAMTINSIGQVGIGTVSPQTSLQVGSLDEGTGEATNHGMLVIANYAPTSINGTGNSGLEFKNASGGGGYGWKILPVLSGGAVHLSIAFRSASVTWSEALHITNLGYLGVGLNPVYPLDVTGDINTSTLYRVAGVPLAASNVVNAVSTIGSYADPAWLTSLSYGKLTGTPSAAQIGLFQTPWLSNINAAGFALSGLANLYLNATVNTGTLITHSAGGSARWVYGSNSDPESTGNAGSNFVIARYSDAGSYLGSPVTIARTTGIVNFSQTPTVAGVPIGGGVPAAPVNSVQWNNAGAFGGSANFVFTNGNVGIGTSSPGAALQVQGSVSINSAPIAGRTFTASQTTFCGIVIGVAGRSNWYIDNRGSNDAPYDRFAISNGSADLLTILTSGYVGIGTSSPSGALEIHTNATTNLSFGYDSGQSSAYIASIDNAGSTNQTMAFQASQFVFYKYTGTGNVGIGVSNPSNLLHVHAASATDGIRLDSPNSSLVISGGDGGTALYNAPNSAWGHAFQVNGVSKLFLSNTGSLGISNNAPTHLLQLGNDDAYKTATGSWTYGSDSRIKRNVRDLVGGLDVIRRVRPIEAEANGLGGLPEGLRLVGFLADEMQKILPGTVGSSRMKLRETDAEEVDLLNLNIHELLIHTVLAVQQLAAMMEVRNGGN